MERVTAYEDRTIVLLRHKQRELNPPEPADKNSIVVGGKEWKVIPVLIPGVFSMNIPDQFADMHPNAVLLKYPSEDRPQIIKTDPGNDVTFTYSLLNCCHTAEDELCHIQDSLRKICRQNVFYDVGSLPGQNGTVHWFDCKGFSLGGVYYSMIFLTEVNCDRLLLGNFHCSFKQYDKWKPVVQKLLTSIQTVFPDR